MPLIYYYDHFLSRKGVFRQVSFPRIDINKYLKLLYFTTLFALIACHGFGQETLFVSSKNGLNLREQPSTNTKIIMTLDFGTPIIVLEKTKIIASIIDDGELINGEWIKVKGYANEKGNFSGYLFDGFLTGNKNHVMDYDSIDGSKEYTRYSLKNIFALAEKLKINPGPINEINESKTYQSGFTEYNKSTSISFTGCSEQDAFILFGSLGGFYLKKSKMNWNSNKKINESEETIEFENEKSYLWEDKITVTRAKSTGQIVKVTRYTSGEGGSTFRSITQKSKYNWTFSSTSVAD